MKSMISVNFGLSENVRILKIISFCLRSPFILFLIVQILDTTCVHCDLKGSFLHVMFKILPYSQTKFRVGFSQKDQMTEGIGK